MEIIAVLLAITTVALFFSGSYIFNVLEKLNSRIELSQYEIATIQRDREIYKQQHSKDLSKVHKKMSEVLNETTSTKTATMTVASRLNLLEKELSRLDSASAMRYIDLEDEIAKVSKSQSKPKNKRKTK